MDERAAHAIASLQNNETWKLIETELEQAETRFWQTVTARIRRGETVDQRELDFARGRFDGAHLVLRQPARAAHVLERLGRNVRTSVTIGAENA